MELSCVMCGKRWMVSKDTNGFGKWLEKQEKGHQKTFGISS